MTRLHLPRHLPIAAKMLGIVGLFLGVIVLAELYAYTRVRALSDEIFDLTRHLTPLQHLIEQTDTFLLQQHIHLERLAHLAQLDPPDPARVNIELAKFQQAGASGDAAIAEAQQRVASGLAGAALESDRLRLARIGPQLDVLARDHRRLAEDARWVLERLAERKPVPATLLLERLERDADRFDQQIAVTLAEIDKVIEDVDNEVAADASGVTRLAAENLGLTVAAGALGLFLATVVTIGVVRPVRRLMTGAQAVERGDLDVEVAVDSRDEIGDLSRSFNLMVKELRSKEQIKATFGKYLDPRIVEDLLRSGNTVATAGQKQVMTVFFSDLEGFSGISERLTPDGLVKLINRYLTMASEPILARRGVIDKYVGDAVMAFWGPPFTETDDHAGLACLAALDQLQQLERFRALLPDLMGLRRDLPRIDLRIGLATGELVVGNIGSDVSRSFTVMGDTATLASRLEGCNKHYGTRILISEETKRMAGSIVETREIDLAIVLGKYEAVRIYELIGVAGGVRPDTLELRDLFQEGLAAYRAENWDAAEGHFAACLALRSSDGPSRVFTQRIADFRQRPPAPDWDGVWHLTSK